MSNNNVSFRFCNREFGYKRWASCTQTEKAVRILAPTAIALVILAALAAGGGALAIHKTCGFQAAGLALKGGTLKALHATGHFLKSKTTWKVAILALLPTSVAGGVLAGALLCPALRAFGKTSLGERIVVELGDAKDAIRGWLCLESSSSI